MPTLMLLALMATTALSIPGARADEPISLFNGRDLSGWHADVPAADDHPDVAPSFVARDGLLVSRGVPRGHLITDRVYENYRLDVEYRFAAEPGNCGVLVHASTPRALYAMFPASIEVQMNSGHAGDFWCIGENIAVADMAIRRRGDPSTWGGGPDDSRRILNLTDDSEHRVGDWNRMVIETLGDRVRVWVNGDLVNDGFDCTASRGQIALQAEGVEVEFRKLELTPIESLTSPESQPAWAPAAVEEEPVRVFILAGQSNMEGKAQLKLLDHQISDPATAERFEHVHVNGEYVVRDDVFINYLDRCGGLTAGYGSPNRIGVELEFGHVLGDHFEQPVLLIKTAWGGKSLYRDFRPPSAGLPSEEVLREILDNTNTRNQRNERPEISMDDVKSSFGHFYREMIHQVRSTLTELDERFPALEGRRYELAGFVWFQGWNDQYNGAETEYEANMAHFIRDVRSDLDAPELAFVIGVMGQNGSKPAKGAMLVIQEAQVAMESVAEFQGNVRAVRTDVLVDTAAEDLYPTWKENVETWETVGSDHPYHYLGSAIWFSRMGDAFAEAMLELMGECGPAGE